MLSQERQKLILSKINKNGSVKINELEEVFKISKMTAWRDLKILESKGLVKKVYGGAVRKTTYLFRSEPPLNEKFSIANKEKELIAKYAANNLVKDSDVIILSGGSTVIKMIPHLIKKKITILTNGIITLNTLTNILPDTEIHSCGGMVRRESLTFIGPKAEDFFTHYNADCIFISGTGFTIEEGLLDPDILDMQVKKKMCNCANKKVVLLDSSKFNKSSLATTLNIEEIDVLVTDENASEDIVKILEKVGIKVVIVSEDN